MDNRLEMSLVGDKPNFSYEKKKLLSIIPDALMEVFEEGEESFFVAGGAITSVFTKGVVNDIDVYPKTPLAALKLIRFMEKSTSIVSCTEKSIFGIYSGIPINVVLLGYSKDSSQIFSKFDFTVNMGSFDVDDSEFSFHKDFFRDLSSRFLRINHNTPYPLMSVFRINKYEKKGYSSNRNEVAKLLLKTTQIKLDSISDVEEHLGGMYGVDLSTAIGDDEYSIEALCSKLSDMSFDFDVTDKVALGKINDGIKKFEAGALKSLLDDKFFDNVYAHDKELYLKKDNEFVSLDLDFKIPKEIELKKISDTDYTYLYKNVRNEDGKLTSCYEQSFEYKLNEEITPSKNSGHLFFYQKRRCNQREIL